MAVVAGTVKFDVLVRRQGTDDLIPAGELEVPVHFDFTAQKPEER